MKNQKIPIDDLIDIGGDLISDSEPTTRVGRWLRWVKKAIQVKKALHLNFKKPS